MPTATLLLSCSDATGIVAAVAAFVSDHGGNIIHADQHTDVEEAWFCLLYTSDAADDSVYV